MTFHLAITLLLLCLSAQAQTNDVLLSWPMFPGSTTILVETNRNGQWMNAGSTTNNWAELPIASKMLFIKAQFTAPTDPVALLGCGVLKDQSGGLWWNQNNWHAFTNRSLTITPLIPPNTNDAPAPLTSGAPMP